MNIGILSVVGFYYLGSNHLEGQNNFCKIWIFTELGLLLLEIPYNFLMSRNLAKKQEEILFGLQN